MTVIVDLSHWNKINSYAKLTAAADLIIHKATEGTSYIDPAFVERMGKFRKAGGRVGSYHFATGLDPVAEAKHYLKVARPRAGEVVALDVEAKILKRPDLVAWCVAWFKTVKAAAQDVTVMIYMQHSAITARNWAAVKDLGVQLWAARYAKTEPASGAWGAWDLWQYTSKGSVPGVTGNVDLNRAKSTAPAVKPAPKPAAPPAVKPGGVYVVRPGDTLSGIAVAHRTTWRQLVAWNRDRFPMLASNPNLIHVGQQLVVAANTPAPNKTHTVKAGDTLSKIAAAAKTSVATLVELNYGRYPSLTRNRDLIQVGWVLYLP